MDDEIAEIKRAVDIVSLVGEYRQIEAFGGKFRSLCPFHDDHKPSLSIDPKFQNYRCWACGAKGDVFTFLQEIEGITFAQAKERLAERAGITFRRKGAERSDSRQALFEVLTWAQKVFENSIFAERSGEEARQYLLDRGIEVETARRHGLGFAPPAYEWMVQQGRRANIPQELLLAAGLVKIGDRGTPYDTFRGRLIFPIRDERNRVLGFGGRILPAHAKENSPKYLNSPASVVYNKSEVLYGIEVAAEELGKKGRAGVTNSAPSVPVVMEGYTDCLMAYQAGLRTAVATCGTALTARHVAKLRQYASRVVLMYDGDEAGVKAATEATRLFLSSEVDLRLCVLPDGLDPCDFIRERGVDPLVTLVAEAPDALGYIIGQARQGASRGSLAEENRALDQVLDHISEVPTLAGSAQLAMVNLSIHRISREFGVPEEVLRRMLEEKRATRRNWERRAEQRAQAEVAVDELATSEPIDPVERQVVAALVAYPARAGDFQALLPASEVKHPRMRFLVEQAYALFAAAGPDATVDGLRERLDDRELDRMVIDLIEVPSTWAEPGPVVDEILSRLRERRRKAARGGSRDPALIQDDSGELEALRRRLAQSNAR